MSLSSPEKLFWLEGKKKYDSLAEAFKNRTLWMCILLRILYKIFNNENPQKQG